MQIGICCWEELRRKARVQVWQKCESELRENERVDSYCQECGCQQPEVILT